AGGRPRIEVEISTHRGELSIQDVLAGDVSRVGARFGAVGIEPMVISARGDGDEDEHSAGDLQAVRLGSLSTGVEIGDQDGSGGRTVASPWLRAVHAVVGAEDQRAV